MKVAMCVSEAVPFAKTGGLADVAGALPQALKKAGVESIVIMPGYGHVFKQHGKLQKIKEDIVVEMNPDHEESFDLYKTKSDGVLFYFVKNDKFFDRDHLYGTAGGDYSDNDVRFSFFAKAVFNVFEELGLFPDILHLHDYHFALAALLLKDKKSGSKSSVYAKTKSVFTIHNLAYQGSYDRSILKTCGIDNKYFSAEGLEFYGKVNFMKAGIVYSDRITTVSPTYAREILTPEYGYGLEAILKSRGKDLTGIINGIDYDLWDPEKDSSLFSGYSMEDLSGKTACKRGLLTELFGKKVYTEKPLFGMVSRLSEQKGLDIIAGAMQYMMENDIYLVILGTGDEKYHRILSGLQQKYSEKFSLTLAYSDKMSRQIYSGSDVFLMPSRYEPCGLGQLISLKYGTVPLVRDTGGLSDTILDARSASDIDKGATGFKFDTYDPGEFYNTFKRVLDFYRDGPVWKKIILNGMRRDFSWDYSAGEYKKLYSAINLLKE